MPYAINWNSKSAIKFEKKQSAKEKSAKNKPKKQANFNSNKPKNKQPAIPPKYRKSTKKAYPNSRENRKVGDTGPSSYLWGPDFKRMLYSVTCYIIMLCECHKSYNDNTMLSWTSNNQCSIFVTDSLCFTSRKRPRTVALTYGPYSRKCCATQKNVLKLNCSELGLSPQFTDH